MNLVRKRKVSVQEPNQRPPGSTADFIYLFCWGILTGNLEIKTNDQGSLNDTENSEFSVNLLRK